MHSIQCTRCTFQGYGHDDHDDHHGYGHDDHYGYGHDDHHGYGHADNHGYGHDDHHGYGHDDHKVIFYFEKVENLSVVFITHHRSCNIALLTCVLQPCTNQTNE